MKKTRVAAHTFLSIRLIFVDWTSSECTHGDSGMREVASWRRGGRQMACQPLKVSQARRSIDTNAQIIQNRNIVLGAGVNHILWMSVN